MGGLNLGLITQLVGQNQVAGLQNALQDAQGVQQDLALNKWLAASPDVPLPFKATAKKNIQDIVDEHGGKLEPEQLQQFDNHLNQVITVSAALGAAKKRAQQNAAQQNAAQQNATSQPPQPDVPDFDSTLSTLSGLGQPGTPTAKGGPLSLTAPLAGGQNLFTPANAPPELPPGLAGQTPPALVPANPALGVPGGQQPAFAGPAYQPPAAAAAAADPLAGLKRVAAGEPHPALNRRQKLGMALIRMSQGMQGRFPGVEAEQQIQSQLRAHAAARQQYAGQMLQDVQDGIRTPQEAVQGMKKFDDAGLGGGTTDKVAEARALEETRFDVATKYAEAERQRKIAYINQRFEKGAITKEQRDYELDEANELKPEKPPSERINETEKNNQRIFNAYKARFGIQGELSDLQQVRAIQRVKDGNLADPIHDNQEEQDLLRKKEAAQAPAGGPPPPSAEAAQAPPATPPAVPPAGAAAPPAKTAAPPAKTAAPPAVPPAGQAAPPAEVLTLPANLGGGMVVHTELPGHGPRNEAAISRLTPEERAVVRALVDYDAQYPASGYAQKQWLPYLQYALLYDPSFSESNYKMRADTKRAFTVGGEAAIKRSFSTFIPHLDAFSKSGQALGNLHSGSLWIATAPANEARALYLKAIADPLLTAFKLDREAVAGELANLLKSSSGRASAGERQIQDWRNIADPASSPEQMSSATREAAKLALARLDALRDQWETAMGIPFQMNFISAAAAQKLQSLVAGDPALEDQFQRVLGGATSGAGATSVAPPAAADGVWNPKTGQVDYRQ